MTELQKTLKQMEATLSQINVSGAAPIIIMGDVFRLLLKAQSLADSIAVEAEDRLREQKEVERDG